MHSPATYLNIASFNLSSHVLLFIFQELMHPAAYGYVT